MGGGTQQCRHRCLRKDGVYDCLCSNETLYAPSRWLEDDFGHPVDCVSELIGVFVDEAEATEVQEHLLNTSEYEVLPFDEKLYYGETYIDVTLEEVELHCGENDNRMRHVRNTCH